MKWVDRIIELRKQKGMSRADLARASGVSYDVLNKIERGEVENPRGDTLPKIASALETTDIELRYGGVSAPNAPAGIGGQLRVLGEVAAGLWAEADFFQDEFAEANITELSSIAPHAAYPKQAQYIVRVRGNSINKIAANEDLLLCVDYLNAGIEPKVGDLALVERTRDGGMTIERTAKRVVKIGRCLELMPESTDPKFQEKVVFREGDKEHTQVKLKAKIVMAFKPI